MESQGEVVLHAVERITASPEEILQVVEDLGSRSAGDLDALAARIVSRYSDRAALCGAATALPAFLPIGLIATLTAGALVDLVFLLKYETEMCLALAAAHGHDIRIPHERQLALLLAAISTCEARGKRFELRDAGEVVSESIWNYTPRRVGKLLVTVLTMVAALQVSRSFLRAIPLIGIGVGAALNKVLTARVGRRAHEELRLRKRLAPV